MKKNVGEVDRVVRILLGAAIVCLGMWYRNLWGLIGLLPFISGVVAWCPLYRLFGISTHKEKA
jgi:hypothetical protein